MRCDGERKEKTEEKAYKENEEREGRLNKRGIRVAEVDE